MIIAWADHACRHCGARLLERRADADARPVYECGSCSLTAEREPDRLCGCGILPKPILMAPGPRFYCTANPDRSQASPAAIVIVFDEVPA